MKVSVLCRGVLILVFLWNGMPAYVNSAICARGRATFVRTSSVTLGASVYTGSDDFVALPQTDSTQCYSLCYHNNDCKGYFLDHLNQTCILTKEEHLVIRPLLKYYQAGSYHRKICLSGLKCKRHWAFDVVPGIRFVKQEDKVVPDIGSEDRCIEACSIEKSFVCRSAIYEFATRNCILSMHDRRTAPEAFKMSFKDADYIENQCISEPSQCVFHEQKRRMLVHLHVYLSISSTTRERCREACVEHEDFRCRSFMFDEARALCLLTPEDSYSTPESVISVDKQRDGKIYELGSCINVKMQCDSTSMTAILRVSKPFGGRVYSLGHPKECYAVTAGDKGEIAITLPLHGRKCGTKNLGNGTFTNDVVVQHHPFILRNTDRRIDIACDYEEVKQRVRSGKEVEEGVSQSLPQVIMGLAPTPRVQLLVVKTTGEGINGVELGDPLVLKVAMLDESVYGIFGSNLVARSGEGSDTMLLIDERGCPVEPNVFPSLTPAPKSKSLQAPFQAFKFASDSTVKFQMTVSFCLDVCPPVNCRSNNTQSFQRHRRSAAVANTSFLEVQAGDFVNDVIMESTLFTVASSKSAPPRAGKLNVESRPFIHTSEKGLCLTLPFVIKVAVTIGVIQVALIGFCAMFLIFSRKSPGYSNKSRRIISSTPIINNAKLFPDIS